MLPWFSASLLAQSPAPSALTGSTASAPTTSQTPANHAAGTQGAGTQGVEAQGTAGKSPTDAKTSADGKSLTDAKTSAGGKPLPDVNASQPNSFFDKLGGIGGILPFILVFVVLYFLLFRGQRKDEKNRKKMVEQMKKGDRVMTIGGMIASVVDVRGDEVVLKVDEANNVKARYIKSAIQKVLQDDEKPEDKK